MSVDCSSLEVVVVVAVWQVTRRFSREVDRYDYLKTWILAVPPGSSGESRSKDFRPLNPQHETIGGLTFPQRHSRNQME